MGILLGLNVCADSPAQMLICVTRYQKQPNVRKCLITAHQAPHRRAKLVGPPGNSCHHRAHAYPPGAK